MKTNILILLAISAANVIASTPAVQLKKSPATSGSNYNPAVSMPRQLMDRPTPAPSVRSSVPMVKPSAAPRNVNVHPAVPSAIRVVPKAPTFKAPQAPSPGSRSPSNFTPRVASSVPSLKLPSARTEGRSSAGFAGRPAISSTASDRLGGITGGQGAAIRQGFEVGNALREMKNIRSVIPEGLRQHGITGTMPGGPGKPNLDIGSNGGFSGRDIRNPLDRNSGFGAGLIDVRASSGKGRRGSDADDMSRTGETVAVGAARSAGRGGSCAPMTYEGHASGGVTASTTCRDGQGNTSDVEVTETQNESGQVTGSVESTHTSNPSTDTITQVWRDPTGTVTGSRTDTLSLSDGKQHIVERDGHGRIVNEIVRTRTRSCGDRNGDIATGGPVGPRVGEVIGLTNLDLLRQTAEGENSSGGSNTMTSGRISSAQVNRGGRDGNTLTTRTSDPHGHAIRTSIGSGLAGPSTGGSSGGNGGGNSPY